ncbi:hypothetical protein POJ06DRAFT_250848 [Lipomyces tetrasporus]|uniref:Uncharacterized protein n=1 Tax=Lipomyces tetrasporus TaxID=54092 RepID=A0AAD7QTV3_9ASCO|nr:uncharacterized protein POJ06DRAFT_250848 [Lipomyces tetrasporus]KAJ8101234.1 hypothetical protein POJ06DRAFT_250848 [Lipomyces tetrasporus]
MTGVRDNRRRQVAAAASVYLVTVVVAHICTLFCLCNQPIMYDSTPVDFNRIDDSEAIFRFRFSKQQILIIMPYLLDDGEFARNVSNIDKQWSVIVSNCCN